jgi:Flp pilus assembly protein TadD
MSRVPASGLAALLLAIGTAAAAQPPDAGPFGPDDEADGGLGEEFTRLDGPDGGADAAMNRVLGDAMKKIAASRNAEARRLLDKKNFPLALARFREAHDLDPLNPEITGNLGYICYLLGNHEEAERLYRLALKQDPERYVTHLNLADLLAARGTDPERFAEAARLLVRARELKGNKAAVILRQARVAVLRGEYEQAEGFYKEHISNKKPGDALRLEIGDFYRDLGRGEEALQWYRQIDDEELGREAAGRIWELEVERQTRKFGWGRSAESIPAKARMLAARGRKALAGRNLGEAERLLREALTLAPAFAEARADLGDLLRAAGRSSAAELEYLRALAVEQNSAEILARLGELYLAAPTGEGRAPEAALFFARALDLRPDWNDLHLSLARALRASGDLPQALRHVRRYLAGSPGPRARQKALALQRQIEAALPADALAAIARIDTGEEAPGDDEPSEALAQALGRARARLARGEIDAAMAELRMLGDEERGPEVLNLESRILLGAGREAEAAEALRDSLRLDGEQPVAHEQLGTILHGLGDAEGARIHLERAEELGSDAASFHLARITVGEREAGPLSWIDDAARLPGLLEARGRLERLLGRGALPLQRAEAEALLQRATGRLRVVWGAGAGLLLLLALAAFVVTARVWGGADLRRLVESNPEAGPDVQRVLSAVRHEVLKHNTMMLAGLVEAIADGQPDAALKALHFKRSLFGDEKGGGVAARLPGYLGELKRIGRASHRRLNLKRRDAAIAPLLQGFALLERRATALHRFDRLPDGARQALLRDLRQASRLLNVEAHEAVRALLDRLRNLEVDEELLGGIFERCRREPAFARAEFGPLLIDVSAARPVNVTIPRRAFEDVLGNLVRNAIQSSLETGAAPVVIGIGVEDEIDPITGLERVVFLVRDRSRKALTAEMIRGRYIEDGLGLTADLVSRHEGTLDVRPEEGGWAKAVVVKLPRAEIGEENGEP